MTPAYTLIVETRKTEWYGSRDSGWHRKPGRNTWVARVTGRGRESFEFLDIPKLPRGVRQGPVSLSLPPGLYRVDDRAGTKGAILVTTQGEGRWISDLEYQAALSDVDGATGNPDGLRERIETPCCTLDVSRLGKVARITGSDRRYRFGRAWDVPRERIPGGLGRMRYRLEYGGIFEVREPEGIVYWSIGTTGEVSPITAEEVSALFAATVAA